MVQVRISHKCPYAPNMIGYIKGEPVNGIYKVYTVNKYKYSKVFEIPAEYVRI